MSNKISSSTTNASTAGVQADSQVEAKAPDQAAEGTAKADADADAEDSWGFGDAAGDFWDDVKGATSDAKEKLSQSAADAEQSVRDAATDAGLTIGDKLIEADGRLDEAIRDAGDGLEAGVDEMLAEFDRRIGTVEEAGDEIIDGGEQLFEEMQEQRAEFSDGVDEIVDEHREQVDGVVDEMLNGAWNITRDLTSVASNIDPADVVRGGADLSDGVIEFPNALVADVVQLGAKQLVEHKDQLARAGEMVEQSLGGEAGAVLDLVELTNPALGVSRDIILKLASAAQNPELIEQLAENDGLAHGLLGVDNSESYKRGIDKLEVGGDAYVAESGASVEVYAEIGGEISQSVAHRVERTGENTYLVEIERGAAGAVGVGSKAQGEGAAAKVEGGVSGRIVLEISGEHAAADAARMMSAAGGNSLDWLRMSGDSKVDVREAFGSMSRGVGAEASGIDIAAYQGLEPGFKTINGQAYVGGMATHAISFDGGKSAQVPDNVAGLFADDSKIDHPLAEQLLGGVPEDLASGLASAYGPTAGVKLGAEPSVSVGVFAPAERDHPIRLEFEAKGTLTFGRTDMEVKTKATIHDVGGLCEAFGLSEDEVVDGLRSGQMTPGSLAAMAEGLGKSIDDYVEMPSIELSATSFDGLDLGDPGKAIGLTHRRGNESSVDIYPPPEGKSVADQLRLVGKLDAQADDPKIAEEDPNQRKMSAHLRA